jgi:phosphoribosyl 1,2-cyclic phosphodiesterase
MIFETLSSSSAGNGYYFQTISGEVLIIECGVPIKKLKESLGYKIDRIVGAIASHSHGDHLGRVKEYLSAGIDVYLEESNTAIFEKYNSHRLVPYKEEKPFRIGEFQVIGYPVKHDVKTNGFLLKHPEMGTTCFITDTPYVEYVFPELNNIIVEANYSTEIMMKRWIDGDLNGMVKDRIFHSHMSFENTLEFLKANDLSKVNQIVLIHLSSGNSDPERFKKETEDLTFIPTVIAGKGVRVELGVEAF